MAGREVVAEDERRHRRGPEQLWGESWYFDFAAPDGSIGGYLRLGLYPNLGVAWYWAALVGRGRRLVMVRDHELDLPRGRDLEVRGQGIWSAVNCETPLDHWSVGLEAFAVALDDPAEAYRSEWGDRIGLGYDLEWEATGPAEAEAGAPGGAASSGDNDSGRYWQACRASGEILVGDEQLEFGGRGQRSHSWGVDDWWSSRWVRMSAVLDDGTSVVAMNAADGSHPLGGDGWPGPTTVTLGERCYSFAPSAYAPLLLGAADGRQSRLTRAFGRCHACDSDPGGLSGVGWMEWLQPAGR